MTAPIPFWLAMVATSAAALAKGFFHSGLPSAKGTSPQSPAPTSAIFLRVHVMPSDGVVPTSNPLSVL